MAWSPHHHRGTGEERTRSPPATIQHLSSNGKEDWLRIRNWSCAYMLIEERTVETRERIAWKGSKNLLFSVRLGMEEGMEGGRRNEQIRGADNEETRSVCARTTQNACSHGWTGTRRGISSLWKTEWTIELFARLSKC